VWTRCWSCPDDCTATAEQVNRRNHGTLLLRVARVVVIFRWRPRSIDIWRVQDGMFVEHWDELNLLEMFQQMGAIPPLDAAPAEARNAPRCPSCRPDRGDEHRGGLRHGRVLRVNTPHARPALSVVSPSAALRGKPALLGSVTAGSFPREMSLEPSGRTLLIINYASDQLEAIDTASWLTKRSA
jgi:hypothetical protein